MQQCHIKGRENPGNWASFPLSWAGHYLQSRTGGHRGCIVCAGDCCFGAFKAISRLRCPATKMWDTITPTVSSEKNVGHVQLLGEEGKGVGERFLY